MTEKVVDAKAPVAGARVVQRCTISVSSRLAADEQVP